jgi:multidrug transporter EmrE-like cation transporter
VTNKLAWLAVAGTIFLTVYGQLVIKWRVNAIHQSSPGTLAKVFIFLKFLSDPWIISALGGAFLASLFWMLAMTRLPLSVAYPFMSLSFAIVVLASAGFLGEALTVWKLVGAGLIGAGLIAISQG